jgi:hypothetical protein
MGDGTNLVKFGEYTPEAADEEAKQLNTSSYFKLTVGNNDLRFLPPKVGQRSPFVTVSQHYVKPPGADRAVVFACPRIMAKQHCLVCAHAQRLSESRNVSDQKAAKELWPSHRTFCNIIDRKNADAGPQQLAVGKTIHKWLTSQRNGGQTGGGGGAFGVDFTHPITGRDIRITRVGTGKDDTEYTCQMAIKETPLHQDAAVMNEWIEGQSDLAPLARVPSEAEILAMMGLQHPSEFGGGPPPPSAPKGRTVEDAADAEYEDPFK